VSHRNIVDFGLIVVGYQSSCLFKTENTIKCTKIKIVVLRVNQDRYITIINIIFKLPFKYRVTNSIQYISTSKQYIYYYYYIYSIKVKLLLYVRNNSNINLFNWFSFWMLKSITNFKCNYNVLYILLHRWFMNYFFSSHLTLAATRSTTYHIDPKNVHVPPFKWKKPK